MLVKRCGDLTCATETKYYKRWQQCTGVVSMCSGCVFEMLLPDSSLSLITDIPELAGELVGMFLLAAH